MKLVNLRYADGFRPAALLGADVLDLTLASAALNHDSEIPSSMKALLAGGGAVLAEVAALAAFDAKDEALLRSAGALRPFIDAQLGPVVDDPDLVLAGSMNSRGHVAEMGDEPPAFPCAFHKVRSALSASGADIILPPGHGNMIDWEGELCAVIGRSCHRVSVEEALDCIVGYTLMNDVSAREFVLPFVTANGASPTAQAWERNVLGKNFPTFAPIGPAIVTKEELPSPYNYRMQTLVNGEVMQDSTQEDLVFGPAEMLSYFSQFIVFQPGDIISMGSPPGVGMARKPQLFLKPGDTVEIRATGLVSLTNRVAAA